MLGKPQKELHNSIMIAAKPEDVWHTLTSPEKVAEYMFGSRVQSSWENGSPIEYYVEKDGEKKVIVKGTILKAEAPHILEHTIFPAQSDIEDVPENYITVTYRIEAKGAETELDILQRDFTQVANGKSRYRESKYGWKMVLPKLKKLVEKS